MSITPVEELPLRDRQCSIAQSQRNTTRVRFKGPTRVLRLCVLGFALPTLLVVLPLYMRYRVYGSQHYPLAMTDMRIIDNRVSTTWCQRQRVEVNATFNAFLLKRAPTIARASRQLQMVRHLILEDDTKEYWGFYLLQGSSVTVSTCSRWPGASLIILRGHKHLQECAYIGDNSSEELQELVAEIEETKDDAPANEPDKMKRHRVEILFHHPIHQRPTKNQTIVHNHGVADDEEDKPTAGVLRELQNIKNKKPSVPDATKSQETISAILNKLQSLGENGDKILDKVNEQFRHRQRHAVHRMKFDKNIELTRRKREFLADDEIHNTAIEQGFQVDGIAEHRGTVVEKDQSKDASNSEYWSSFSSSEEALLSCNGLILNLPLTPHSKCSSQLTEEEMREPYLVNTITYKVPVNGYYFFVFNSENEVQPNYIRVRFQLDKKIYNVTDAIETCTSTNKTGNSCILNLNFFSSEKLVLELPLVNNETLWNEEFLVVSECEPRTAIYVICVIAVPIVIVSFAFL